MLFFSGPRRRLILLIGVAAALANPTIGLGQSPIRLVVPFAAGGTQDALARLLARNMAEGLQQTVLVENRPGGGSVIGTRHVVRSAPDGRTLLIAGSSFAATAVTHQLDYDLQRDLQPVIRLAITEIFLVANGALALRSIADLKRLAQQRPSGVSCGGLPGPPTMACERMRLLIGDGLVTIPFQSLAPALNAVVAGHVDVMFSPRPAVVPLVAGNQLSILAAGSDGPAAPPYETLPLLKDTWPNMLLDAQTNVYVPAGTPAPVIASLNREINRILALPEVRATLKDQSFVIVGGSADALAQDLARDIKGYRQIAQETGLKPQAAR